MENQKTDQTLKDLSTGQVGQSRETNLRNPATIEHRLEFVEEINGVEYINDSKATDLNSTWYSLECMQKPVVWIIETCRYEEDYSLFAEIATDKVKALVILGDKPEMIANYFEGRIPAVQKVSTILDAAVVAAANAQDGNVVLFSPACSAFDTYRNYAERGQLFRKAVREMRL